MFWKNIFFCFLDLHFFSFLVCFTWCFIICLLWCRCSHNLTRFTLLLVETAERGVFVDRPTYLPKYCFFLFISRTRFSTVFSGSTLTSNFCFCALCRLSSLSGFLFLFSCNKYTYSLFSTRMRRRMVSISW